jgi:hypothetical protein
MRKTKRRFSQRIFYSGALVLASVVCTGCLFRFIRGREIAEPRGQGVEHVAGTFLAAATISVCGVSPIGSIVECTYSDESSEEVSRAQMIAEQTFIGDIFDPLVLELPAGSPESPGLSATAARIPARSSSIRTSRSFRWTTRAP